MWDQTSTRERRSLVELNLTSCLARLTRRTWHDSDTYQPDHWGGIQGRARPILYVCVYAAKIIGTDPWGFSSRKTCIYFSRQPSYWSLIQTNYPNFRPLDTREVCSRQIVFKLLLLKIWTNTAALDCLPRIVLQSSWIPILNHSTVFYPCSMLFLRIHLQ